MPRTCALWVTVVRWFARITALFLAAMLLLFIFGEGPPPFRILAPWLVVLAGFALGWRYEALGGLLILSGFVYFNAIEFRANGHLLRFGAFHLLLAPSLLFLIAWCGQLFTSAPMDSKGGVTPGRSCQRRSGHHTKSTRGGLSAG